MFALIAIFAAAKSDSRLDPFQFNICVWDLEGIDEAFALLANPRESDEDTIAEMMYKRLSTCDAFVLPGLRNRTTAQHLIAQMEEKKIKGFTYYPQDGVFDSTVLSKVDLENLEMFQPNEFSYPIENSKCNYTGEPGVAMLNMSFYADINFHDPVPKTHLFSMRLKSGSGASNCAFREAQADMICKKVKEIDPSEHIYVAGSFEDYGEGKNAAPYQTVLQNCGLIDLKSLVKFDSPYTRKNRENNQQVYYDNIWVNKAVKDSKYVDTAKITTSIESALQTTTYVTYPLILFTRQQLTKKWKIFEISYSFCIIIFDAVFFTWLMFYSRIRKTDNYQAI